MQRRDRSQAWLTAIALLAIACCALARWARDMRP